MQTFLLAHDHVTTARFLDSQRLGKQRVEAMQIINVSADIFFDRDLGRIRERSARGYVNHPAVKMWRGYELALAGYGLAMSLEWASRGFRSIMVETFEAYISYLTDCGFEVDQPSWWVNDVERETVIRSHRSNLIRKDPAHYQPLFPEVPADLPYHWPA